MPLLCASSLLYVKALPAMVEGARAQWARLGWKAATAVPGTALA